MSLDKEIHNIKLAAEGDIRSFESLVNNYKDRVVHICYSYCNNQSDAEDIAQEVFVEVYKSLKSFNYKSSFLTWIYRIASNKSIDFLRKQKRLKRGSGLTSYLSDEAYYGTDISSEETPSAKLIQEQRKEFLYYGLSKLPERQQRAFVLTQIEGMSHKEAAEVMNTTVKSLEVLVVRGRKKLKAVLEKQIKNYL